MLQELGVGPGSATGHKKRVKIGVFFVKKKEAEDIEKDKKGGENNDQFCSRLPPQGGARKPPGPI